MSATTNQSESNRDDAPRWVREAQGLEDEEPQFWIYDLLSFIAAEEEEFERLAHDEDDTTFRLSLSSIRDHSERLFEALCDADKTGWVLKRARIFVSGAAGDDVSFKEAAEYHLDDNFPSEPPAPLPAQPYEVQLVDPPEDLVIDIGQANIDSLQKLVVIEGLCQQASDQSPRITTAAYTCEKCGNTMRADANGFKKKESLDVPEKCVGTYGCENTGCLKFDEEATTFAPYQELHIQERPEQSDDPTNPSEMQIDIVGANNGLGNAKAGERVIVLGHLKMVEENDSTIVKTYIDATNVTSDNESFEAVEITPEDIDRIQHLADLDSDELFEVFQRALAPDIIGRDKEKMAAVLQLFGGVSYVRPEGRERGEIHILYIGDPGTAKTDLLNAAANIAPLVQETTGEGASGVGLTANVERKEIAGNTEWVAKAGPVVLADRGHITIDEFDKISSGDKSRLNNALEKGFVKLDKAGVHTRMNSRVSALVAANPVNGDFDRHGDYIEQFNLSKDLMDRFDLIFPFEDEPDEAVDKEIAKRKRQQRTRVDDGDGSDDWTIDHETLRKYVAFARREVDPQFAPDSKAGELLDQFYLKVRDDFHDEQNGTVGVNPRTLNTLHRLSEASARARLSETIEVEDVQRAIDLVMYSLNACYRNPDGEFDVNKLRKEVDGQ